jgi:hypothetical protein
MRWPRLQVVKPTSASSRKVPETTVSISSGHSRSSRQASHGAANVVASD